MHDSSDQSVDFHRGNRRIALALTLFLLLSCGGIWFLFVRDKLLATFPIGQDRTLNVYAESAFLSDDSMGHVSYAFEVKQRYQTIVPRRQFHTVRPGWNPRRDWMQFTADDQNIVALALNHDVLMIHEFSSGFTWPGSGSLSNSQLETAESLFQKLRAATPRLFCSGLEKEAR